MFHIHTLLRFAATLMVIFTSSFSSALQLSHNIPATEISKPPEVVSFLIFDSPEAVSPIAIYDFLADQYQLAHTADRVWITAELDVELESQRVWVELALDGASTGERLEFAVSSPGVTFAQGNNLDMDGNTIINLNVESTPDATDAANVGYVDQMVIGHDHDGRYYTRADIDALVSRIEALETKLADVSVTYDGTSGLKTFNIENVGLNITSQSGHSIILDDSPGAERITILDKTGNNGIEISSNDNSMTFMSDGDYIVNTKGNAILKSGLKFSVDSGMDLSLDSAVNMEIQPKGNLTIGGTLTEIIPGVQLKLTAPLTKISGGSTLILDALNMEISGGSTLDLDAPLITIN